jgi:hypothetical protein
MHCCANTFPHRCDHQWGRIPSSPLGRAYRDALQGVPQTIPRPVPKQTTLSPVTGATLRLNPKTPRAGQRPTAGDVSSSRPSPNSRFLNRGLIRWLSQQSYLLYAASLFVALGAVPYRLRGDNTPATARHSAAARLSLTGTSSTRKMPTLIATNVCCTSGETAPSMAGPMKMADGDGSAPSSIPASPSTIPTRHRSWK